MSEQIYYPVWYYNPDNCNLISKTCCESLKTYKKVVVNKVKALYKYEVRAEGFRSG
jgi:hypothetical protein